jgi:alkyl sulfatase BDS1-like metallo-beta-lactamase superfamily hydrolase
VAGNNEAAAGSPAPKAIEVSAGVWVLPAQGNAFAVDTAEGLVLVDTGPGGSPTRRMIQALRACSQSPIMAICYSHGHTGYNFGIQQVLDHVAERGERPPRIIAQRNLLRRFARYRETEGYQAILNEMQFPGISAHMQRMDLDPTETFDERLILSESPRVELFWAPSETDDALAVWLPDTRTLYAGAALPLDGIPNVGTPLRTQRLTVRWADTLDRLVALRPERLIIEFGPIIEGEATIAERLTTTSRALRWLREAVVSRLNRGLDEKAILADLEYPQDLFGLPWMRPIYGSPDYVVRDLVREESGWWDRNPTSLHPADPTDVARATFDAINDPDAVVAAAQRLADTGQTQLALHVVDIVALGPDDEPVVRRARTLKATLCRTRATEIAPLPSRNLYRSSARLLDDNTLSWEAVVP